MSEYDTHSLAHDVVLRLRLRADRRLEVHVRRAIALVEVGLHEEGPWDSISKVSIGEISIIGQDCCVGKQQEGKEGEKDNL